MIAEALIIAGALLLAEVVRHRLAQIRESEWHASSVALREAAELLKGKADLEFAPPPPSDPPDVFFREDTGGWHCLYCFKRFETRNSAIAHVEAMRRHGHKDHE